MADARRHLGWPVGSHVLGRSTVCVAPSCCCPQALLFVWPTRRGVDYELQTRDGKRFEGSARAHAIVVRFAAVTMHDEGLERMRVVAGPPVEVARA